MMPNTRRQGLLPLLAFLLLSGCGRPASETEQRAVVTQYVAIADAAYTDALTTARTLAAATDALAQAPGEKTLAAARSAWQAARLPYSQTEALRFGNWNVDDWEGRVNAWPVDEGLLDYVEDGYAAAADNPLARANLVANELLNAGATQVDTRHIGPATLKALNGLMGLETNVTTGYHAIEFYLWGQDRSETGPGNRPWTDFAADGRCTRGAAKAPARECERRNQALQALTQLLVQDLIEMQRQWNRDPGSYGSRLSAGDPREALRRMLFGMGSLALEELSGERIQAALLAHEQEEEQDCFSDQTHFSHYYNALGIENFYLGQYRRANGEMVRGASLSALVARRQPELDLRMRAALAATRQSLQAVVDAAAKGQTFDRLITPGNTQGEALLQQVVAALTEEARSIEAIGAELRLLPLNPAATR